MRGSHIKMLLKAALRLAGMVMAIALLAGLLWVGHFFLRSPPERFEHISSDNAFITTDTMISAHRSGAGIAPENTMAAFRAIVENDIPVDIFEVDLHMTADGVLVLLHDDDLERTSDSEMVFGEKEVRAKDKTLEELKRLNMGAMFTDADGVRPYAELHGNDVPDDLRIAELDDVLDYLTGKGDYRFIIEVKDDGERGKLVADRLYEVIRRRELLDRVIFASFHDDIMQYIDDTYPDTYRGASVAQTSEFFFAALLNRKDYTPRFNTLQPPFGNFNYSYGGNFALSRIVNYAHRHGIALQYWTVNDPKDMQYLLSIGADGITTDYPELLYELKASMS